jgi:hypothetical protein
MQDRIEELDALRGLMLVWITCTHLPTVLSAYINQPLGFVSATEGFIFISALFTGRIYLRIAERNGYGTMWWKLSMRAGKLYCYQLLLLAFTFVIEAPIAAHGNTPAVHNLLDFYFAAGHTRTFVDAALMIYRSPLLDILPIYIILIALTPFALILGGGDLDGDTHWLEPLRSGCSRSSDSGVSYITCRVALSACRSP